MGTFQRSITVLFAIGLKLYLRLEVDASYIPTQYPMNGNQDTTKIFSVTLTWLSHFKARLSRQFQVPKIRSVKAVYNTTSPSSFDKGFSLPCVVFSRSYLQHLDWFLFLQVLRRFNSLRSLSLRSRWEVSFRYLRFKDCMRLAGAFCGLPHPSSAFEPSHPPNSVGFSLCTVSWISTNSSKNFI